MLYIKKDFSLKRRLKYLFFVILLCWGLISIYVIYQYLLLTSKQVVAKWGTFVEGIFDTTSFLPYLRNDEQSRFYQSMLYKSCLTYDVNVHDIDYQDDMCHVTTKDYQHYSVSLNSGHTWSDGVPVSIEDVFYTYNDILSHNLWDIPHVAQYEEVKVSQENDGSLSVTFPTASADNTFFFTNYILPRHALFDADLGRYQKNFAIEPVYNKCARIMPQSTDQYSLVFDLSSCEDSHLWFYQIKNTNSFDQFNEAVNLHGSIVDAYVYPEQASGYVKTDLMTNKFLTLFFNTKSKKTSVRLRRSLGGFIKQNFYSTGYEEFAHKYDDELFNHFLSTGWNIKDFLGRVDSTEVLSKWDLLDIGVKPVQEKISLSGENKKLVYFAENINNIFTFEFTFDVGYDKIVIHHNNDVGYTPKSYNKKNKTGKYNIGTKLNNLKPGINKYTVYWYKGTEKITVATIDLYNLKGSTLTQEDIGADQVQENLTIVYYGDANSIAVVEHLKSIFTDAGILDHFDFEQVETNEEMEGKLLAGDYDIIVNTINMWFKKDLSRLFNSDKPQVNHSQYKNARFTSILQQYLQAKQKQKETLLKEVNDIYANDMPFIILGTSFEPLYIKSTTLDKLSMSGLVLHQENRRTMMYENLQLVENINIDVDSSWSISKFRQFLKYALKRK